MNAIIFLRPVDDGAVARLIFYRRPCNPAEFIDFISESGRRSGLGPGRPSGMGKPAAAPRPTKSVPRAQASLPPAERSRVGFIWFRALPPAALTAAVTLTVTGHRQIV